MMNDWLEYKDDSNGGFLRNFYQSYFDGYLKGEKALTFHIEYSTGEVYKCILRKSNVFKGLTYIQAINEDTNTQTILSVGDDNIVRWLPPKVENDLMVG